MTHVTRRTKTTRKTPPKSAIMELPKNIIVTRRQCIPNFVWDPQIFWTLYFEMDFMKKFIDIILKANRKA